MPRNQTKHPSIQLDTPDPSKCKTQPKHSNNQPKLAKILIETKHFTLDTLRNKT